MSKSRSKISKDSFDLLDNKADENKRSPAQAYSDFMGRRTNDIFTADSKIFEAFVDSFDFPLDDFQIEALRALDQGKDVLVAAPTGSGKTLIGQYGATIALYQKKRIFYTTPIKALSNQKYHEFVALYGDTQVGLLTGDVSVNPQAEVVVMTTEVLRNMIYMQSEAVNNVGYVVLDEVHYLGDKFRGPVWEEVVLQLPKNIHLVSLSATISKAHEIGDWLTTVRGETVVVSTHKRPVPLEQQMIVGRKLYPLFSQNPKSKRTNISSPRAETRPKRTKAPSGLGVETQSPNHDLLQAVDYIQQNRPSRWHRQPTKFDILTALAEANQLPVIYFIFSRQGCDSAVEYCIKTGICFTTKKEQKDIEDISLHYLSGISASDAAVLRLEDWLITLSRGIAAHHAGILPVMKEIVEHIFSQGIVKVVFATETLALGINMPARSVVVEKITKWDGAGHNQLTAGEFTQLTGRAGRRGIDTHGYAVTIAGPAILPHQIALLVSQQSFPLNSAFKPTYTMAVGLLKRMTQKLALELLSRSFAQFQSDRRAVSLVERQRSLQTQIADLGEGTSCHLGDFAEYSSLMQQLTNLERAQNSALKQARRNQEWALLRSLSRGDLVQWYRGRRIFSAVVLDTRADARHHSVHLLTVRGSFVTITNSDTGIKIQVLGHMRVPKSINKKSRREFISRMSHAFSSAKGNLKSRPNSSLNRDRNQPNNVLCASQDRQQSTYGRSGKIDNLDALEMNDGSKFFANEIFPNQDFEDEIERIRLELRHHPCHKCKEKTIHIAQYSRISSLMRQEKKIAEQILRHKGNITTEFEKIVSLLQDLDYIEQINDTLLVTEKGSMLAQLFCERSLLVAQCLQTAAWKSLSASELAACIGAIVYTPRSDTWQGSDVPGYASLQDAVEAMNSMQSEINYLERKHGLDMNVNPEPGVIAGLWSWVNGGDLADLIDILDMSAGDAVRFIKQVIDLLVHISNLPDPVLSQSASLAVKILRRGVVAWSSF